MKHLRKIKRTVFLQMLAQHLMFILLPLALFLPLYLYTLDSTVTRRESEFAASLMDSIERSLYSRIEYIDEITNSLLGSRRVRELFGNYSALSYEDMVVDIEYVYFVSDLRRMHYLNSSIAEIVVYTPDYAVSSMGFMRSDEYFRRISGDSHGGVDFVLDGGLDISSNMLIKPISINVQTDRSLDTVAIVKKRMDHNNASDSGIIVFCLAEYFDDIMSQEHAPTMQVVYADHHSRVIAATKSISPAPQHDGVLQNAGGADYIRPLSAVPGNLLVFRIAGAGLRDTVAAGYYRLLLGFIAAMLLITIGALVIRYVPVARFFRKAVAAPGMDSLRPENEMQLIEGALQSAGESIKRRREQAEFMRRVRDSLFLYEVATGTYAGGASPDLSYPCRMLLLRGKLEAPFLDGASAHGLFAASAIIAGNTVGYADEADAAALLAAKGLPLTVIGPPAADGQGLHNSYARAHEELLYGILADNCGVYDCESLERHHCDYAFPIETQLRISSTVLAGNAAEARTLLDAAYDLQVAGGFPGLACLACLYDELVVLFVSCAGASPGSAAGIEEIMRDNASVGDMINLICDYASVVKDHSLSELLELIDDNLSSPELSLSLLSDKTGMSQYQISRKFKSTMLCGFHEYVARRRIDEAKRLLARDGLGIKSVAVKTGFASVSSFIRMFRQYEGITPGEYRVKHK